MFLNSLAINRFRELMHWHGSGSLVDSQIVYAPPEGPEFRKLAKITRIGGYDCYSPAACTHRNQCIVSQSPLSYLLVIVLCGQTSEYFPSLSPIIEVGDKDPGSSIEITLETFYNVAIACAHPSIEFLEHNRAQPHRFASGDPSQT